MRTWPRRSSSCSGLCRLGTRLRPLRNFNVGALWSVSSIPNHPQVRSLSSTPPPYERLANRLTSKPIGFDYLQVSGVLRRPSQLMSSDRSRCLTDRLGALAVFWGNLHLPHNAEPRLLLSVKLHTVDTTTAIQDARCIASGCTPGRVILPANDPNASCRRSSQWKACYLQVPSDKGAIPL